MGNQSRPGKPYPDFPLFAHASGQWAKKIKQKMYYFGVWADSEAALRLYQHQLPLIRSGSPLTMLPDDEDDSPSLHTIFCLYLEAQEKKIERAEISPRHFTEVLASLDRTLKDLGRDTKVSQLRPAHFTQAKQALPNTWGPITTGNHIQRVRTAFNWAAESDVIAHCPKFGPEFKKPTKRVVRVDKQRQERERGGKLMYSAEEIRNLLEASTGWLRACIYLGINCSFGPSDCGGLRQREVATEFYRIGRAKSGVERCSWLWPETREAIAEAVSQRPDAKFDDDANKCFLTSHGRAVWWETYNPTTQATSKTDSVSKAFIKVERKVGTKMSGRGFYSLRRTFETIGARTRDQPAVDMVMGHTDSNMSTLYRQEVSDDSIRAVCEFVRQWLHGQS